MDGFEWLLDEAEKLNTYVPPVRSDQGHANGAGPSTPGDRPGDHYNRRASWDDILGPAGWRCVGRSTSKAYWRRPGKDYGWSATTGYCHSDLRGDLLYVFSTSATPFEAEQAYSKFEAYTLLRHGGDYHAAADALLDEGYGARPEEIRTTFAPRPGAICDSPLRDGNKESNPQSTAPGQPGWPLPIPASRLQRLDANTKWVWHGCLSRGGVTLLAALWKAGKTTLLAHLLRAFEGEGLFCGLAVKGSRVLYISEEDESTWAERRDELGLKDHLEFIPRPFRARPTLPEWRSFLAHLASLCTERAFDVVVFDTISKMWSVRDENDAPAVENALLPLYLLTDRGAAVLLVHHIRKGDGAEATAARGSGSLPAFVETILELRRFEAGNRKDTRRVLTGYGRYRETPSEVVIDLTGAGYELLGDKDDVQTSGLRNAIRDVLPRTPPGITQQQVREKVKGRAEVVNAALNDGAEAGFWKRDGTGGRGSAYLYWMPYSEEEKRRSERAPYAELLLAVKLRGPLTAAQAADLLSWAEAEVPGMLEQLVREGQLSADEEVGEDGEIHVFYRMAQGEST